MRNFAVFETADGKTISIIAGTVLLTAVEMIVTAHRLEPCVSPAIIGTARLKGYAIRLCEVTDLFHELCLRAAHYCQQVHVVLSVLRGIEKALYNVVPLPTVPTS